ncbi:DUF5666 domain-containing protein [Photobacterium damselae]|uniref:DUF5666 domain-containing protein n=1 Tax=Photobacterium damselae TaxID=38293 RepID=UPI00406988AD
MKKLLVSALVSSILVGCGGGGSDSSPATPPTPPTPESSPINMIGSIEHVDHTKQTYSVNGYSVKINDLYYGPKNTPESLDTSILQKGMMLKIEGNTAYLEPTAVGTIQNISPDRQTFTVNGVLFKFDLRNYDIDLGNTVIVSSLPVPNGHKVLSVVKIEQETLMYSEIEGIVSCVGGSYSNDLIKIGNVQVNHKYASKEDGPIKNGDWIEAYGKFEPSGIFKASSIEIDNDTDNDFYDDSEIEGFISWVYTDKTGPYAIGINRITVELDSNTRYEHGNKSLLTMGREIDVSIVKKGDKLVAREIEFDDDEIKDSIHQKFEDVTVSQSVYDITGTKKTLKSFVINNKTVYVDRLTRFEDGLHSSMSFDGRIIEVEAVNLNGKLFAREIELEG